MARPYFLSSVATGNDADWSLPEVIPISENQDSVGPMTRSVADAAAVLSVIAGPDPKDKVTLTQPTPVPDYTKALDVHGLKGKRIGVPREAFLDTTVPGRIDPVILQTFEKALDTMRSLGAIIVDPADLPSASDLAESVKVTENIVLNGDFKVIKAYFMIGKPLG